MPELTIEDLLAEAQDFSRLECEHWEPTLYNTDNGKTIGTYIEQKFTNKLAMIYLFDRGNSAVGIDFPGLGIDIKTTSVKQPQSSCPFKSAGQKIYGLGYDVLVFVYRKSDNDAQRAAQLTIVNTIYIDKTKTGDFQTTRGIRNILKNDGNEDDLVAFFQDRKLPIDDIAAQALAEEIMANPPDEGYLTISNAQQWRLKYTHVIKSAGSVDGIVRVV